MKKTLALIFVLVFVLSMMTVAHADDYTDSVKSYSISRLGVNGTLWSSNTVKRNATYNAQQYLCSVHTFSTLDGGSNGHFTTRPYLSDKSTKASAYAARMSATNDFDGYSLSRDYAYTTNFYFKFVGNPNYAIKSTGNYLVGHDS